nr:MAG TPA: hypothetical protein [Caudoviricetes sp.]
MYLLLFYSNLGISSLITFVPIWYCKGKQFTLTFQIF